jgi:hypothetical protein
MQMQERSYPSDGAAVRSPLDWVVIGIAIVIGIGALTALAVIGLAWLLVDYGE